jgi:hypothetical protein
MDVVAASYTFIGSIHGRRGVDWEIDSQATMRHLGRVLDALTVQTCHGKRTYYFDVTRFFGGPQATPPQATSASQRTTGIHDFVTKEMRRLAIDLRDRRAGQQLVDLAPLQLFRLTVCWLATADWHSHPSNPLFVRYQELVEALQAISQQLPGHGYMSQSDIGDLFVTARQLVRDAASFPGMTPTCTASSWNFAKLIFGDKGLVSDLSETNPLVAQHHAHFFGYLVGEEIPIDLLDDPV